MGACCRLLVIGDDAAVGEPSLQPTNIFRALELPPCDLVLDGGVASALTHPRLLSGLSKAYRLKRLGGTSAGAVGAALGAVAQLARDRGAAEAFDRVDRLPSELGERLPSGISRLANLFQPAAATRRTFALVMAVLDRQHGRPWGLRLAATALRAYFLPALLGGAVGGCVMGIAIAAMVERGASIGHGLSAALGVVIGVVFAALLVGVAAVVDAVRGLNANDFGLCRGVARGSDPRRGALTVWLNDTFNSLLGRAPGAAPVTFGELWGCDVHAPTDERRIDLQLVTTALNLRQQVRVPGDSGENPLRDFFYDPQEWKTFFPVEVMTWLQARTPVAGAQRRVLSASGADLRRLPEVADLPIIVAVRLSLSFPVLLSALPMYIVDPALEVDRDAAAAGPLKAAKVYFSDGGITGDFPIDLFDTALPAHPTFGVALRPVREGDPLVDRPGRIGGAAALPCVSFEAFSPWHGLFSFARAVVESARIWRDTAQQGGPGCSDRMVRIGQTPAQRGSPLGMTATRIDELGALGRQAAGLLIGDFGPQLNGYPSAWDVHRWLRMRTTLDTAGRYLDDLSTRLDEGTPSYRVLPYAPMSCYKFDAGGAVTAAAFMNSIGELMARTQVAPELTPRTSNPQPPTRITSFG
jgi:predicted acylesterase/phospholipase RssA